MHATDAPASCENCTTALQGHYCHACGQSAANPLRHFGHAVEDLFESFWHLDGRVFRTLRDLFVPGRVACNYLAGQRVRYIAPLRMFVITTLATFFLAGLALQSSDGAVQRAAREYAAISRATTPEAVLTAFNAELADLALAREKTGTLPGVAGALDSAEARLREQAAQRLAQVGGDADEIKAVQGDEVMANEGVGRAVEALATKYGGPRYDAARPWHEFDNPIDVSWLPGAGDRWLNHRIANAKTNADQMRADPGLAMRRMLAAVPAALFVLVPVFALLLKLLYVRSGWSYLEHLVVGLYSHVFLLIGVAALVLLGSAEAYVEPVPVLGPAWGLLQFVAVVSLPVYLLLMQKRVYRQGWPLAAVKYLVLGGLYQFLVLLVTLYALLAGLTSGS